jgi:hypothetical protein
VAAPLIVRLVMDAAGYLKTVDTAVASNTKLEQSSLGVGEAVGLSAKKQVEASLKASEALKVQIADQRALAVSVTETQAVRDRANLLADRGQARLNSALGLTTAATLGTSNAAKTGERDLGKFTRGALAGSGAASSLGRSLAFASTGFIAIAGGATLIAASIRAAILLQKTQRQIDTQLTTSGKSWDQYGQRIDQADLKLSHISGFTNQELLQSFTTLFRATDNVSNSLHLNAVAADVARGRGISLAAASNALAKAAEGSFSALRRLNIIVPKGSSVLEALTFVQQKYAGQAAAGATVSDKFHSALVNVEEVIGTALLPGFTKATTAITDWLAKVTQTGQLQRDLNQVVAVGGVIFQTIGSIISTVDRVTGSFGNTLKIIVELYLGRELFKAVLGVEKLAASWGLVAESAGAAATAQEGAVAAGVGAGATGAARGAAGRAALGGLSNANIAAIVAATAVIVLNSNFYKNLQSRVHSDLGPLGFLTNNIKNLGQDFVNATKNVVTAGDFLLGNRIGGPILPVPATGSDSPNRGGLAPPLRIAPGTDPVVVYAKYQQTIADAIAVAQAALTKTTADDVAIAKRIIAQIKQEIARGHLKGAQLVAALQDEKTQQTVLDNARATAAQQAATIAATKKATASSYTTPIDLQLAEARAQLTKQTADDIAAEKQILAAAKAAVAAGKKNKQGQLAALQIELQAQQALQSLRQQNATSFTLPARLQLALAKAQALGQDQVPILKRMKASLERALKAAKGNIQKQIDIYNQIYSINQQLGAGGTNAYGDYKKASVKALTSGQNLTAVQRRELEQRLSRIGPGGTVPGTGTGAAGFIIGPDGRPIQIHHHRRPRYGRDAGGTGADGGPRKLQAYVNIRVYLEGKDITRSVTIEQQRYRRGNPSSRRGPNAGVAHA